MNSPGRMLRRWIDERTFVRNVQAGVLLENFFIAAVASVLIIRLYLFGIAYRYLVEFAPVMGKVVAGPIHFSHILWGGLLMLVGFIMLLAFLGRSGQGVAAVIGGIGFGTFIDSLGKLITLHPNYFYQPAVAFIYIIFVGLFIGLRVIQRPHQLSPQAALANALQYAQQAVLRDFGPEERRHAITMLEHSGSDHPMVAPLRQAMDQMDSIALRPPSVLERARGLLRSTYVWLVRRWWFTYATVGLFVVVSMSGLYQTVVRVSWSEFLAGTVIIATLGAILLSGVFHTRHPSTPKVRMGAVLLIAVLLSVGIALHLEQRPDSVVRWIQLIAPIITSVLVMFGTLTIWRSRLAAYRMFHMAILVSIFVTQVFAFYDTQVLAVTGLALRVLILVVLRFMIDQEETAKASRSNGTPSSCRTVAKR